MLKIGLFFACDPTLWYMLIFENKRQTSQKYYSNNYITYFLNNVGSHAKTQPLLSTNEKKTQNVS